MRKIGVVANATALPMIVQIDPMAFILYLLPGEQVVLVIYVDTSNDDDFDPMEITYSGGQATQIVWLPFSYEFFFLEDGMEIYYLDYGTNVVGAGPSLCKESHLKGVSLALVRRSPMFDTELEGEWFTSLDSPSKQRFLAALSRTLTIAGRNSYTVAAPGLDNPEQLKVINEVQHRVSACLLELMNGTASVGFQRSIAAWVLKQTDAETLQLMRWAWGSTKEHTT